MPFFRVEHKGLSLDIPYKNKHYYLETEFEPGKNLYQIVFGYLVDGRMLSVGELVRKYKKVNRSLGAFPLNHIINRIKSAQEKSQNPRVRKLSFVRPSRGGASPVLTRLSKKSRFTPTQKNIIEAALKRLYAFEASPSNSQIRNACLAALRRSGLAENVVLADVNIKKAKARLGLPPKASSSSSLLAAPRPGR